MILAAYSVQTSSPVFAPASWAATTRKRASDLAKTLSIQLASDRRYPNAFWVLDARGRSLAKWHQGKQFQPGDTI